MGDSLDDWVGKLQDEIDAEARSTYGEEAFRRWQSPRYVGVMENPDGHGRVTGSCGDTMQSFLKFEDDRVRQASFTTDGCGPSTICGSFAAEMALGRSVEELADFSGEAILERIGGLPEDDRHCAYLAAASLRAAVDDYMAKQAGRE
jgi:nitrogen fixation NifU-like protein